MNYNLRYTVNLTKSATIMCFSFVLSIESAPTRAHIKLAECTNNSLILMFFFSKTGNENIVRMLIKKGADVDITNKQGSTALHSATIKGNVFENPFCSFILNDSKLKIIEEFNSNSVHQMNVISDSFDRPKMV